MLKFINEKNREADFRILRDIRNFIFLRRKRNKHRFLSDYLQ